MRLMTIASGSSGNCIYVGSDSTHVLIDTGVSRKAINEGLKVADLSLNDIDAIFITHEHIDHINAAGVIMRNYEIPFFSTAGTMKAMSFNKTISPVNTDFMNVMDEGSDMIIGDLKIHSFHVSHDASDPVAYTVLKGDKKVGLITDLGFYDKNIIENLSGCNAILCEANYDERLLQAGPYPYSLKRRIAGDRGHLSNEDGGKLISNILNDNMTSILLGHLSKENNYDKLAFETVKEEIDIANNSYKAKDFNIEVAKRNTTSSIIKI